MYASGYLVAEPDILELAGLHHKFGTPFHWARLLKKELDTGRVRTTVPNLELLASLYQASRDHENTLAVQKKLAHGSGGTIHLKMAETYEKLEKWPDVEKASLRALNYGGLTQAEKSTAWERIGHSNYQRGDRKRASRAFRLAESDRGRSWSSYIGYREGVLHCFEEQSRYLSIEKEAKVCKRLIANEAGYFPEKCETVDQRLLEAKDAYFMAFCSASPNQ
jgi:hypothetical protein